MAPTEELLSSLWNVSKLFFLSLSHIVIPLKLGNADLKGQGVKVVGLHKYMHIYAGKQLDIQNVTWF